MQKVLDVTPPCKQGCPCTLAAQLYVYLAYVLEDSRSVSALSYEQPQPACCEEQLVACK